MNDDSKNLIDIEKSIPICNGSNNASWRRALEETLNSKVRYCKGSINLLMQKLVPQKIERTNQELVFPDFQDMFPVTQNLEEDDS